MDVHAFRSRPTREYLQQKIDITIEIRSRIGYHIVRTHGFLKQWVILQTFIHYVHNGVLGVHSGVFYKTYHDTNWDKHTKYTMVHMVDFYITMIRFQFVPWCIFFTTPWYGSEQR